MWAMVHFRNSDLGTASTTRGVAGRNMFQPWKKDEGTLMTQGLTALTCGLLLLASTPAEPLTENSRIVAMHAAATKHRSQYNLPEQELDEELCQQAQRWANNMAARGYMYHGGGEQVVAHGYATPEACIRGWIYSPGHRVWVLGRNGRCGFGCQKGANGRWYYAGVYR